MDSEELLKRLVDIQNRADLAWLNNFDSADVAAAYSDSILKLKELIESEMS